MAEDAAAPQLHYELLMSVDDGFCKPVTALYNEMLTALIKDPVRAAARTTDFEARMPDAFKRIGLTLPPSINGQLAPDVSLLRFTIDHFDSAGPRDAAIIERVGANYRNSQLYVLKPGVRYREVDVPEPSQPGIIYREIDPAIIDKNASDMPASQGQYVVPGYHGYLLTKWPDFDRLYHAAAANGRYVDLPRIDNVVSTRVFQFEGKAHVLKNQYVSLAAARPPLSLVLAYKPGATGPDDVCYLALVPAKSARKSNTM
jgi:hypothetical protein